MLRLLGGAPVGAGDANPLASLFTRLKGEADRGDVLAGAGARVIEVGDVRLVVHPSYAASRAGADGRKVADRREIEGLPPGV